MSYPWALRLRSRTSFRKCVSQLVNEQGWLAQLKQTEQPYMQIPSTLQEEILQGFKKFYHPAHPKRGYVDEATGITWAIDATGKSGGFILMRDGQILLEPTGARVSVSAYCKKPDLEQNIRSACRGAVHCEQILAVKTRDDSEIDHCNDGGFIGIYHQWRRELGMSTAEVHACVVSNDKMDSRTSKVGFRTLKEPLLTGWKNYHQKHAKLQELTREEHVDVTRRRKRTTHVLVS